MLKPRAGPDPPPIPRPPVPPPNRPPNRRRRLRKTSSKSGGPCSGLLPPPQGLRLPPGFPPGSFQAMLGKCSSERSFWKVGQPTHEVEPPDFRNASGDRKSVV